MRRDFVDDSIARSFAGLSCGVIGMFPTILKPHGGGAVDSVA